jgi:hypothetical protein
VKVPGVVVNQFANIHAPARGGEGLEPLVPATRLHPAGIPARPGPRTSPNRAGRYTRRRIEGKSRRTRSNPCEGPTTSRRTSYRRGYHAAKHYLFPAPAARPLAADTRLPPSRRAFRSTAPRPLTTRATARTSPNRKVARSAGASNVVRDGHRPRETRQTIAIRFGITRAAVRNTTHAPADQKRKPRVPSEPQRVRPLAVCRSYPASRTRAPRPPATHPRAFHLR